VPPFTDQDINTYHNLLTSKGSWLEDPQKVLSEESMMVHALDPDIWSKPMSLFSLSSNRTLQFMRTAWIGGCMNGSPLSTLQPMIDVNVIRMNYDVYYHRSGTQVLVADASYLCFV
jgi:hypothetical protein